MTRARLPFRLIGLGAVLLATDGAAQPDFSKLPCRDPSLLPGEYIDEHLIYFDHGSSTVPDNDRSRMTLRSAACWINRGGVTAKVLGHADTSGDDQANLRLSQWRARAIADRLVALGVTPSRIAVEGRGERAPAVATGDGVPEQLNRRSTISWTATS